MSKQNNSASLSGRQFNTLAQNGTSACQCVPTKPIAIIAGRGSQLGNSETIQGRAKRKMIGQVLSLSLIDVARGKENDEMIKALWNTHHCQSRLITVGDRYYGQYCKNRFCPLCCSIRKARIINSYYPEMKTWQSPVFLTLTVKAVKRHRLRPLMAKMTERFIQIVSKYRKRDQRGNATKLIGVRSLECNFNPDTKTYNPHFHIIAANQAIADILKAEWLNIWKYPWTISQAQFSRPVQNLECDLIEIIKYGTKILPDADFKPKRQGKGQKKIYIKAQYNIYEAMKGFRIFERFGFNRPKTEQAKPMGQRVVTEFNEWHFLGDYFDWQHGENELVLSGYQPSQSLKDLLFNNVNFSLE